MANLAASEPRVELLGTVRVLHAHLTANLCRTVL
jgi:hypothetical protein